MFFPTLCTGSEEAAGPEPPSEMGCSTLVWVHLFFSCRPMESYAGYLAPCGGLGSDGATMASPFFPEFPGTALARG